MSHIETGRTGISEVKLRALLGAYGVTSETLVDTLAAMARSTGKGWWTAFSDAIDQRGFDLAELEATAKTCRTFQALFIPGLLQTPDYMRALFAGGEPDTPETRIDRYAAFRQRRQQVLHCERPPSVHAVIHEAAFHMHFVPREVMRAQLEHLVVLSRLPHITIQLLPFREPSYPTIPTAPFVIFDPAAPELRTVYVEHPVTASFMSETSHISHFATCFERLSNASLPALGPMEDGADSSLRLIQHLRYVLEEATHAGP